MKCVVVFVLIELSVTEIMIRGAVPIVVIHKLLVSDWKDFLGDEFIIVHSLYHIRNTEAAKKFFHVAQVFFRRTTSLARIFFSLPNIL